MTSQILKFVDFTETQKENETSRERNIFSKHLLITRQGLLHDKIFAQNCSVIGK